LRFTPNVLLTRGLFVRAAIIIFPSAANDLTREACGKALAEKDGLNLVDGEEGLSFSLSPLWGSLNS
jgi:hypothetical protein